MLDFAIAFLLGLLVASLLGFAMLPLVWARALRLVRRKLETGIPISMAEVRAGRDLVRAEAAMNLRRLEERVEAERERRHGWMAESGRQALAARRHDREIAALTQRLHEAGEEIEAHKARAAEADDHLARLRTEVATAGATIALHEETLAAQRRQMDALGMEADGRRVELVALRTRLANLDDEVSGKEREQADLAESIIERDGRLAEQAFQLANAETALAGAEQRLAAANKALQERGAELRQLEASHAELERRVAFLTAGLQRQEAASGGGDPDERLLRAAEREAALQREVESLRAEGRRLAADLARGTEALRSDGRSLERQLEEARAERARLQGELARLRREGRGASEAASFDNQILRAELARIAADIARAAGGSGVALLPAAPGLFAAPANDDRGAAKLQPADGDLVE